MKCLRCGWCCKTMSPINGDYCPNLTFEGKIAVCAIYRNRPDRCENHKFDVEICPLGMSSLKLDKASALEYWREIEQQEDIRNIINNY